MFATVVAAHKVAGRWQTTLQRAAIDQVFANVSMYVDANVTPTVVNAQGGPVAQSSRDGVTIRGPAAFGARDRASAASFGSVFDCSPNSADSSFASVLPLPLSIKLHDMHVIDQFDPGSLFPRRDPFLLMQFSGQADASIGFQAKAAFSCELSQGFLENHRIEIPIGSVGPVPVTMYLEPTLKFDVSESGSVSLTQRHYFAVTLEQNGFAPFSARLAHSADPVQLTPSVALKASLFAGGDLSVMFGGGVGSINVEAGIYGAFGPDFELAASTDKPGCLTATVKLEADLGVRLEFLDKRWSPQLASITSPVVNLGGPWCIGGGSVSVTNPGDQTGIVSTPVNLQVHANDTDGGSLTYSASGLPAGLSISPSAGSITGTPSTAGASTVTVTATDASGPSATTTFAWAITAAGGSVCPTTAGGGGIVLGQAIDGICLGETQAQANAALGAPDLPTSNQYDPNSLWFYNQRQLGIYFVGGKAMNIYTASPTERTEAGVGPGSSLADLRNAYPNIACTQESSSYVCNLQSSAGDQNTWTIFPFFENDPTEKLGEVAIQYAPG